MPLNALNLMYCKAHVAQILMIEDIDNIIKGALEVFLSVCATMIIFLFIDATNTFETKMQTFCVLYSNIYHSRRYIFVRFLRRVNVKYTFNVKWVSCVVLHFWSSAVFSCRLCFLRAFPFIRWIINCMLCIVWKKEILSCARGISVVAYFITSDGYLQ